MLPHLNYEYSLLFKVPAGFGDFLSTSKVASLGIRLLLKGSLSLHSSKNQSFVQGKTSPEPPPLPLFSSAGQVCGQVTSEQMAVVPDDGISCAPSQRITVCVFTPRTWHRLCIFNSDACGFGPFVWESWLNSCLVPNLPPKVLPAFS